MLAKLAARNVRRSARDYGVFFVTVALGVAMFYAFNAIKSQAVLYDAMTADSLRMLGLLDMMMGIFSVAVACVLGFLVVYANRFIIKRRKREFGMYLMLGMGASRVSAILLFETVLVGLASLAVGLAAGIGLSQGLSFVTAALMGTTMTKYQFIVSGGAVAVTCVCFLAIFAVSAVVDILYVNRCRLASLLSTHESGGKAGKVCVPVRVAAFVASVVLLGLAYWQLDLNGMMGPDEHFFWATGLMVAGTFLFFWSVSGFVVAVLQRAQGVYFRGLTMFTVRQVSSKMNTTFASLSVVAILLFFALTTTSVGMALVQLFVGNINDSTRYDATIISYPREVVAFRDEVDALEQASRSYELYDGDMQAAISAAAPGWDGFVARAAQVDYYECEVKYADLFSQIQDVEQLADTDTLQSVVRSRVLFVGASQFNAVSALAGGPQIELADDECLVNNLFAGADGLARALAEQAAQVEVGGMSLHFVDRVMAVPMRTTAVVDVALEVVVSDACIEALKADGWVPAMSYLDCMYSVGRLEGDRALAEFLGRAFPVPEDWPYYRDTTSVGGSFMSSTWPCDVVYTGQEMADQASGLRMVITYLAVYIGFVLLMTTAAILAIQQLSETTDSLPRYRRLSTLGAAPSAVLRSLCVQTGVYFLAPLALAASHTACAVSVVNRALFTELGIEIGGSTALACGLVVGVYAIYFALTYLASRSFVKDVLA